MITPQMIKQLFLSAVHNVTAHIKDFSLHPGIDFSRTRKLPPDTLIRLLVAEGASSTRVELLDFFGFDPDAPTSSAFRQQRAKLRPDAIKEVLDTMKAPRGKPSSVCSASEPLVLRPLRHLPHIPASLACERGIPIFFLSSLYIISVKLICPSISVPLYIFLYSFP